MKNNYEKNLTEKSLVKIDREEIMKKNNSNLIGRRIKSLRKHHKLTQDQLGEKIGLKKAMISRLENGSVLPSRSSAELIAVLFNVSVDYILGNIDTFEHVDKDTVDRYNKLFNLLMSKDKEDQDRIVELLTKLLK